MARPHRRDRRSPAPSGFGGPSRPAAIVNAAFATGPGVAEVVFAQIKRPLLTGNGVNQFAAIGNVTLGPIDPTGFVLVDAANNNEPATGLVVAPNGNLEITAAALAANPVRLFYSGGNTDLEAAFGVQVAPATFPVT